MEKDQLKQLWKIEEQHVFEGWNFSHLKGRWESEGLPWQYKEIVVSYLQPGDRLLDMGTGGGEFLLTLQHPYHLTAVTESYEPNVKLCEAKLKPLGIEVKQVYADTELPFKDESFDIIINRHESFCTSEVNRILKKGGYFITQQVGGENNCDLSRQLIDSFQPKFPEHNLKNNITQLEANGFEIIRAEESFPFIRFYDVGALAYYAKVIEWEFPDFSVESCFQQLCKLQEQLEMKYYIEGKQHRFIIIARKCR